MKIETKYDIGQKVYEVDGTSITPFTVRGISTYAGDTATSEMPPGTVCVVYYPTRAVESQIVATFEEAKERACACLDDERKKIEELSEENA